MKFPLLTILTAALFIAQATSSCPDAASLQFVTIIRAGGCPLTMYFPTDSSVRAAYLAPAFCINQSIESVLRTAPHQLDSISGRSFLSIPVTIANSRLLTEAQETLRPVLQDRKLEFLQLLAAQQNDATNTQVTFENQSEQEIAHVDLTCSRLNCTEFLSPISPEVALTALVRIELQATVNIPGSNPVTLRSRILTSNENRILTHLSSPLIKEAPTCTTLTHQVTITINESCRVNVLKRTDMKGHFLIQPMVCYNGNQTEQIVDHLGARRLTLTLEVRSKHIRDIVHSRLSHLEPLSVTFMSVIRVNVHLSKSPVASGFEDVRLTADGDRVEVRFLCKSSVSCKLYNSNFDLRRHVSFTLESQPDVASSCIWRSNMFHGPVIIRHRTTDTASYEHRNGYQPVYGKLCLKPEFTRELPVLHKHEGCEFMCSISDSCKAFSTASGSCQLFVFDKCSRNFLEWGCEKRGLSFVKKLPGLAPGRLCPTGYGDDWHGMKYKVYNDTVNWVTAKRKCDSESGLVTLSDATNLAELTHIKQFMSKFQTSQVWLGGEQKAGSDEPAGGWNWVGCNSPINNRLWGTAEPNNAFGNENVVGLSVRDEWLNDFNENTMGPPGHPTGFICKCISPFL